MFFVNWLPIGRAYGSIYKVCFSFISYSYWWNLHVPRFGSGRLLYRFLFPLAALSLKHCFACPFSSAAQAELSVDLYRSSTVSYKVFYCCTVCYFKVRVLNCKEIAF